MILAGEVRGIEQRSGGSGDSAFSFTVVYVLEGLNMHQARLGDQWGPVVPRIGENIVAEVEVRTFSRRNGQAGSQVNLVRPVDPSVLADLLDAATAAATA